MANYYGTTVSRGGKLKKGFDMVKDRAKLNEIIAKYNFGDGSGGDLNVSFGRGELQVWGESSTFAYYKDDEEMENEVFDKFLEEICPFLGEPLIVSEVGNEKCRYVLAYAYIAFPNGKVVSVSLDEAIDRALIENK